MIHKSWNENFVFVCDNIKFFLVCHGYYNNLKLLRITVVVKMIDL